MKPGSAGFQPALAEKKQARCLRSQGFSKEALQWRNQAQRETIPGVSTPRKEASSLNQSPVYSMSTGTSIAKEEPSASLRSGILHSSLGSIRAPSEIGASGADWNGFASATRCLVDLNSLNDRLSSADDE
jgi:hypothetical protein